MTTDATPAQPAPKVQRYWAAVAKRLGIEAQEMAGLLNHNGERGRANESSFGTLFSRMLPPSVRVSTGEIIDSLGESSAQIDTLVLSNTIHPVLFAQTEEMLFPVETVLLCIEVKTTLTSEEVEDIAKKVRKHRKLVTSTGEFPVFAVFAHKAGGTPRTIAKWFFELDPVDRPAFFLVNDSAVFGCIDDSADDGYRVVMPIAPTPGESDTQDFGPQIAASPDSWKPMDLPKGQQVRIDQGAAMLLFVRESLKTLSVRGHAEINWLGSYLDKIQQQHVRYLKGANGLLERS
jgi:hypothetical protein